jgi:hypothetical protein
VSELLLTIAREEQGLGKRNVEVIESPEGETLFLLNAVPLMRLAHQFVHAAISQNKGKYSIQVGFASRDAAVQFRKFIVKQSINSERFTDDMLADALNNVPGVQYVTEEGGGGGVAYINVAGVRPFTMLSGYNQGDLLRSPVPRSRLLKEGVPFSLLTHALRAFASHRYKHTTIRGLDKLHKDFFAFCRTGEYAMITPDTFPIDLVDEYIRSMPEVIVPLAEGEYRIGQKAPGHEVPRKGDGPRRWSENGYRNEYVPPRVATAAPAAPRSFKEDFGVTLRYFVAAISIQKMPLNFQQFLNAFEKFCTHRGRGDWNPALYDPENMREVFLSTNGFYVVMRRGGETEEMYALHHQHRHYTSSSLSFGDDYGAQIREFISDDSRPRRFPTSQRLLNALGQFCIGKKYDWDPWSYNLADIRLVLGRFSSVQST